MAVNLRILAFWLTVLLSISQSTAFFWGWGGSEPTQQGPPQMPYPGRLYATYHPRFMTPQSQQGPPPQSESIPVPAIPIQVPLKAQLAPQPNIHNVQLVPCLCPVSPDEYDKDHLYNQYNLNSNSAE